MPPPPLVWVMMSSLHICILGGESRISVRVTAGVVSSASAAVPAAGAGAGVLVLAVIILALLYRRHTRNVRCIMGDEMRRGMDV